MIVYQTNAGLGYLKFAFLLRLDKTKNGYNYLCIGTQFIDEEDEYVVGEVTKDLEDDYVTESPYEISQSPLYGTFLFDFYIKTISNK